MFYRFELNGYKLGNMAFRTQSDAEAYLRELMFKSEERYQRALKAGHSRMTKTLRQAAEDFQQNIRIVPVSKQTIERDACVLFAGASTKKNRTIRMRDSFREVA